MCRRCDEWNRRVHGDFDLCAAGHPRCGRHADRRGDVRSARLRAQTMCPRRRGAPALHPAPCSRRASTIKKLGMHDAAFCIRKCQVARRQAAQMAHVPVAGLGRLVKRTYTEPTEPLTRTIRLNSMLAVPMTHDRPRFASLSPPSRELRHVALPGIKVGDRAALKSATISEIASDLISTSTFADACRVDDRSLPHLTSTTRAAPNKRHTSINQRADAPRLRVVGGAPLCTFCIASRCRAFILAADNDSKRKIMTTLHTSRRRRRCADERWL